MGDGDLSVVAVSLKELSSCRGGSSPNFYGVERPSKSCSVACRHLFSTDGSHQDLSQFPPYILHRHSQDPGFGLDTHTNKKTFLEISRPVCRNKDKDAGQQQTDNNHEQRRCRRRRWHAATCLWAAEWRGGRCWQRQLCCC